MEGCQGTLHTNKPVRGATGAFWCQERMQPSEHVRMHELSVDVWPVAAALLTLFVWTLISDFSVSFTMLPHHLETDPSLVLPWGWEWANQPSYFRSQRCPQTAAPKSLSKLTFSIDYYWRHTYSCIPPASSLQDSRHLVFLTTQLIKIVQTPYHIKRDQKGHRKRQFFQRPGEKFYEQNSALQPEFWKSGVSWDLAARHG